MQYGHYIDVRWPRFSTVLDSMLTRLWSWINMRMGMHGKSLLETAGKFPRRTEGTLH